VALDGGELLVLLDKLLLAGVVLLQLLLDELVLTLAEEVLDVEPVALGVAIRHDL
jgi:hypothetical protein